MKIEIKILNKEFYAWDSGKDDDSNMGADLPYFATAGSAAVDLVCTEDVTIYPGETKKIHTGLAIWIGSRTNSRYEKIAGLILPRSGLGSKGLILANTIGLIDSDYQGELLVNVWNRNEAPLGCCPSIGENGDGSVVISAGDRFAQLLFIPVLNVEWERVEDFSVNTSRGIGGFGSTNS